MERYSLTPEQLAEIIYTLRNLPRRPRTHRDHEAILLDLLSSGDKSISELRVLLQASDSKLYSSLNNLLKMNKIIKTKQGRSVTYKLIG